MASSIAALGLTAALTLQQPLVAEYQLPNPWRMTSAGLSTTSEPAASPAEPRDPRVAANLTVHIVDEQNRKTVDAGSSTAE